MKTRKQYNNTKKTKSKRYKRTKKQKGGNINCDFLKYSQDLFKHLRVKDSSYKY